MSVKKSLKLNVIMNAILNMSAFIFPLITFPYVSRVLLPEGTGKVAFATSLISYFLMIAQLGIPTYGVRACAKVRDDKRLLSKTAHELLIINLVMMLVSYGLLLAVIFLPNPIISALGGVESTNWLIQGPVDALLALCNVFAELRSEKLLYLVCSLTIFFTTLGMEWLYKALEQYTYITVRSIVFKAISVIAMFFLVHAKEDYVIYGGITIMAASASGLMNFIHARKYITMRPMGGYEFKPHLKAVAIFFAMSCASQIYTHLDTVMLGFMDTDTVVGYYNAAVRIKQIMVSVVTSLGMVLLPRASYYVKNKQMDQFQTISRKSLALTLMAAASLTLYFILYARDGIYFLSGDAYEGSVLPMQLIMPTLLFIGLSTVTGIQILVPMGREKTVLYSIICGAVVDVILNLILIPSYGASGAAAATSIAELVVTVFQFVVLWKDLKPVLKKIQYWKILLGLLAGVLASFWVMSLPLGSFLSLVCSALLFFVAYGLVLVALKEELVTELLGQMLRKVFKK